MTEFTGFDRDELAGVAWMHALPKLKHAALAIAVDGGQHEFQARCPCRWEGPLHNPESAGLKRSKSVNTRLWRLAVLDADEHNAQYAAKEIA